MIMVLHVGGHIGNLVEDNAGLFVDAAIRCLNEAILVDSCESGQIGDESDVGTLRGLNGAHAAIVGIVDVTDLESSTVTGETARAEGGETTLMGKLCQRVCLIHELGQRRRTEELADGGDDRADIDECLRSCLFRILSIEAHALTDNALHSGETDTELVLKQLADRTDAAVSEVVDVVDCADIVIQTVQIADGRQNILICNGLRDEVVGSLLHDHEKIVLVLSLVQDFHENIVADTLVDADILEFFLGDVVAALLEERGNVDHAVGDDDDFPFTLYLYDSTGNTGLLNFVGQFTGDDFPCLSKDFAGVLLINDVLSQNVASQTVRDAELLIIFITSNTGEIITVRIKEEILQVGLGGVQRRRLAGTQSLIDLQKGLLMVLGGILLHGSHDTGVRAEEVQDVAIRGIGLIQRTDKCSDRNFSVLVNTDIEYVVLVGLIFEPRTTVRNDGGGVELFTGLVVVHAEVDARGTDELGDNGTLRAIDDEGTALGHKREVAHIDVTLFDLAGLLIIKARFYTEGGGICGVSLLALLNGVFGFLIHCIVNELKNQVASKVGDFSDVSENLFETDVQEPLVGIFLDFNEVGHFHDLIDRGKVHTGRGAAQGRLYVYQFLFICHIP